MSVSYDVPTMDGTQEECIFEKSITYNLGPDPALPAGSSLAHLSGMERGKKGNLHISSWHMACMCPYMQKLISKEGIAFLKWSICFVFTFHHHHPSPQPV